MAAEPATDGGDRGHGPGEPRWRVLYASVLLVLAVEIALLWAVTRAFP
jgi:hypothetical protein